MTVRKTKKILIIPVLIAGYVFLFYPLFSLTDLSDDKIGAWEKASPIMAVERRPRDSQLTIWIIPITDNISVIDGDFQITSGETVGWEVKLFVYNLRASTGWRYWIASLEFGPELLVEAGNSPGTINPVPGGGSPVQPGLIIEHNGGTQKTEVVWDWHSLMDNTPSDFPKRAKAETTINICSCGYEAGRFNLCDNAKITYMTGAKRPKEATYELDPIIINVVPQ